MTKVREGTVNGVAEISLDLSDFPQVDFSDGSRGSGGVLIPTAGE